MAFCGQCGAKNPDENKFCANCGAKLVVLESKQITEDVTTSKDSINDSVSSIYKSESEIINNTQNGSGMPTRRKRSIPWMIVGIVSLIISIVAWVIPGMIPTFMCIGLALLLAILALCFKGKLKAIPIIALIITTVLLGSWGIEGYHYLTDPKEPQDVTYGRVTFTIPAEYLAKVSKGDDGDVYRTRLDRSMIVVAEFNQSFPKEAFSSSKINIEDSMKELAEDWLSREYKNVQKTWARKKFVAGLPGVNMVLLAQTENGYDLTAEIMFINDNDTDKILVIANIFDNRWTDSYKGVLDTLLETVKATSAGTVGSSVTTTQTPLFAQQDSSDDKSISENDNTSKGVDPELKEALDGYEEFMNKYVDFMNKYQSYPNNALAMLTDYTDMITQYAQYAEKIDAYDAKKSEMSKEDLEYYLDVTNRVEKKLLDVAIE